MVGSVKAIKQYLWILFISMLPIVELRGALPAAAHLDLHFLPSYLVAVVGNMLPVPFLILFSKKLLGWLSKQPLVGDFFTRYLTKANEKAKSIGKYELLGLCLFVGVPLPMTGAWTGAVIAAILQLRMRPAIISIGLGVMISGVIMGVLSYGASGLLSLLFA